MNNEPLPVNDRRGHRSRLWLLLLVCAAAGALAFSIRGDRRLQFFLPGTQPGQVDTAATLASCKVCHLAQVREWSGSMCAYACRSPLFNAQLAITSKTTMDLGLDAGEYCLRCHAPSAWMAGRSHWMTVQNMYGSDLDGVNCDFCHRMVDPLNPDSTTLMGGTVPGYGNGMYAVQQYTLPVRGARGLAHPFMATKKDAFYRKSEFCGVCHDESNVYFSDNPVTTPPHRQMLYQRTYSEWLLSWFATQGEAGTCQSCHMPRGPGSGSSLSTTPPRLDVAMHDFTGGNTLGMPAVLDTWTGVDRAAVDDGVERSMAILRSGLKLEVAAGASGSGVKALVRITNLTGHKLPTGFPEGRRLWIDVRGRNQNGETIFESGRYDSLSRRLTPDPQLKVYETKLGVSQTLAAKYNLLPGPSFNESLNDTVYLDNRIPPKGYSYERFRERRAEPIGYPYAEGQYWDVTPYALPPETRSVEVKVLYQVASGEYVEYLRDQNAGNTYDWNGWGEKSYSTWRSHGSPVTAAEAEAPVASSAPGLPPVGDVTVPLKFYLAQNFPNPFNAGTTIEFWLSQPSPVTLSVYDIGGREIGRIVDELLPEGPRSVRFDGSNHSSGIYFYRLRAAGGSITKKFIMLK